MEKQLARWSFLAGMVCLAISVIWRVAFSLRLYSYSYLPGTNVYYGTFFRGAFLLLLLSIAAAQIAALSKNP